VLLDPMTLLPLTAVLALNLALVTAHTYVPILNAAKADG
jgi:hypothetical protein